MNTRKQPPEPAEAVREPARPIEYGRWAQRADRRHGIRDGRNRIPSLAEVNEILARFHPDYAALRRYLVENGFMTRENSVYWRSGGTFDV